MNIKKAFPASLAFCLFFLAGCSYNRDNIGDAEIPPQAQELKLSKEIILVPLGDFPTSKVEDLVKYYQSKYNLVVKTVPPLKLTSSVIDPERRQLIAEEAIELMQLGYPRLTGDPRAVMIGLTDVDMFVRENNWQFTFSWRQQWRFAVVSDARMSLGAPRMSPEIINSRLRKMVTKNIGIMYYGLRPNDDPHSVMYNRVGGIDELDYMGEDF